MATAFMRGDETFFTVGYFPGRKKPVIYVTNGANITVLAAFQGPSEMDEFTSRMVRLLGVTVDDQIPEKKRRRRGKAS